MSRKHLFISLAVPIILLFFITLKPLFTMVNGTEITIQTKLVDPRDLFYGDYVHLNYDIESVSSEKIDSELRNEYGKQHVYVQLVTSGGVYVVSKVTKNKPDSGIFLKAFIYGETDETGNTVVEYNFGNRYYVAENTGKTLEEKVRAGKMIAHLKVRDGYGLLTDLTNLESSKND